MSSLCSNLLTTALTLLNSFRLHDSPVVVMVVVGDGGHGTAFENGGEGVLSAQAVESGKCLAIPYFLDSVIQQ